MRNLISVVMPVYNAAPFLKEAVDSLLMQSFLDFELIVVEDASTDHSLEILDTYRDSRILVLKNEVNRGNYPSRNIGMSVAKGKYICVMDADDIALPHRLAVQFQFMETHPEILACGSAYQVIGSNEMYRSVQNYESIQEALLLDNCFLHPSLCFRTSVLKKIGMYNEDYIYASDYDFLCKMALVGPIVNLPDILMKYRWHNGQITQAHRLEQIKYANIIRRNYQKRMIQRFLPEGVICSDCHLAHAQMGYILFLYVYARNRGDKEMGKRADSLLDYLLSQIHEGIPIGLENGLCGIAFGLLFLLRNNYVEGDEEIVMKQIDCFLRKRYTELEEEDFFTGRAGIDFYFQCRDKGVKEEGARHSFSLSV